MVVVVVVLLLLLAAAVLLLPASFPHRNCDGGAKLLFGTRGLAGPPGQGHEAHIWCLSWVGAKCQTVRTMAVMYLSLSVMFQDAPSTISWKARRALLPSTLGT